MNNNRLPIQVVVPRQTDYSGVKGGGSNKALCPFTEELRNEIETQCVKLKESLKTSFSDFPNTPCIAKVVMKEKAIAKTHKPTAVFKSETCPIVGTEKLDEVLIKVTPSGIDHLISTINKSNTKEVQIALTKIKEIVAFDVDDKIDIKEYYKLNEITKPVKIKLFSFADKADSEYYIRGFESLIAKLGLSDKCRKLFYSENVNIYKIECRDKEILEKLIQYPGVHKMSFFPQYVCIPPNIECAEQKIIDLELPIEGKEYPIIGIIDSGISLNNKYLSPWIYKKEEYVANEYQDNDHGTFVAGIIEYGNILNNISSTQQHFRILDAVVFPNIDPKKGKVDYLTEDMLILNLYDLMDKYANEVKVWNMSLGTDELCKDIISDLAVALDEIQDIYNVDIIISAGNYEDIPLREWPPVIERNDQDRITVPADSVRALTVGSIANIGIKGFVEKGMPSPFSRKGPGANYVIKPEVVYEGGNCTKETCCNGTGIVSFDVNGNLVEGIGTSYSAPGVAALYATIRNSVREKEAREYAKAFLIHSCELPKSAGKDSKEFNKYFGFGRPNNNLDEIISCSKSKVTLVFKGELYDKTFIEFNDFPFPNSLIKNGKCYGKIKMTLSYTPRLDANNGQEYCRANIDAHLGTYDSISDEGKIIGFTGEVPIEKKWDNKYEMSRVENGFKWNPIKSYSRELKRGIDSKPWRLMVDCHGRLGEGYAGQTFVLLVTIEGNEDVDIYSEVIQMLRERGYIYNNLKIQNQIRQSMEIKK